MPYEGEYANYGPLRRIAESETVQSLLKRSRQLKTDSANPLKARPKPVDPSKAELPEYIVAIDGSNPEVSVRNGYPGARIGYCTVASVLLNMKLIDELDRHRPIDPVEFRKTETVSTIDAALPGSNIVTHKNISARDSFREALYEVSIHGGLVNWCQRTAGSGGSQGLPASASRIASSTVMLWAAAESR